MMKGVGDQGSGVGGQGSGIRGQGSGYLLLHILTNKCCNYNEVVLSYIQLSKGFPIFCN